MSFGMGFSPPATTRQGGGGATLNFNFLSGTLDPRITFSRATVGTYYDSSGILQTAAINGPRFDYDPSTLLPNGLLLEGARTNLLLNSLLNGTSLSTQSVTVTAVAHTLSFYGTGTVDLTGAFVSTVVGTGAYPTRTTLTFTPTAGSLTLTVTGTVQFANLEVGPFASSFIPTAGTTATRNADSAIVNSSTWYNLTEGTLYAEALCNAVASPPTLQYVATINDGTATNRIVIARNLSATTMLSRVNAVAAGFPSTAVNGVVSKSAIAYSSAATNTIAVLNGTAGVAVNTPSLPAAVTRLVLGADEVGTGAQLFGWLRNVDYYPTRLSNATLQSITA
jgi:hypothetical protein